MDQGCVHACPDEVLQLRIEMHECGGKAENVKLRPPEASCGHSPVEIVLLGVLWA